MDGVGERLMAVPPAWAGASETLGSKGTAVIRAAGGKVRPPGRQAEEQLETPEAPAVAPAVAACLASARPGVQEEAEETRPLRMAASGAVTALGTSTRETVAYSGSAASIVESGGGPNRGAQEAEAGREQGPDTLVTIRQQQVPPQVPQPPKAVPPAGHQASAQSLWGTPHMDHGPITEGPTWQHSTTHTAGRPPTAENEASSKCRRMWRKRSAVRFVGVKFGSVWTQAGRPHGAHQGVDKANVACAHQGILFSREKDILTGLQQG